MTLRKRGLGRGLEALLVDVADKEEKHQPVPVATDGSASGTQAREVDGRTAMVVELFKSIQREHLVLLDEAEALRALIDEFESIVRADLS